MFEVAVGVERLIPARAGNTSRCVLIVRWRRAHPRSRGEHRGLNPRYIQKCGSSPLVRGTCTHQRNQPLLVRLIPARAGNTSRQSASCSWPRAHPRSRGEHLVTGGELAGHAGSSPLARGTWSRRCGCWWVIRLIPACAGNTTHPASSPSTSRAHPHSRGEHAQPFYNHVATFGSSPLARGAQSERLFELKAVRLIPARVGSTPT